jgi:hypothetical protein
MPTYYGSQALFVQIYALRPFLLSYKVSLEVELDSPGSIYALKEALYYAGNGPIAWL